MATYKVIQDIEAEDHILGPLTLRQFIYGLIASFFLYICFICLTKHVAFLLVVFLPPAVFAGFFAFPFGKDQPTEIWALAKIRFLLKPHRRIWDQSGVKELVTVTAPKNPEIIRTNGLDQAEVKSRLRALADTIDSRGWAIKNVNVNLYSQPLQLDSDSDRLVTLDSIPQPVPDYDIQASDDILDEANNPIAHHMDQMIAASATAHRQTLINELSKPTPEPNPTIAPGSPAEYWFLQPPAPSPPPGQAVFAAPPTIVPSASAVAQPTTLPQAITPEEEALLAQIKAQSSSQQTPYSHLRTLQPLETPQTTPPPPAQPLLRSAPSLVASDAPVTPKSDPAILALANNNDLNVSTLARQAHKNTTMERRGQDEVVISLH